VCEDGCDDHRHLLQKATTRPDRSARPVRPEKVLPEIIRRAAAIVNGLLSKNRGNGAVALQVVTAQTEEVVVIRSARVWGKEVFDGQPVGRNYVLQDGDIVELRA
jgi:hypothetical protein